MKKVILFMAGILASMMLNAQSRWSVTPEAGLVVNKENEGTSVTLGFKAGAGVLYQLKEGVGSEAQAGNIVSENGNRKGGGMVSLFP